MAEQFSLLFPVFSGSVSTSSLWRSRGAGKLSAPQRRGHCQGSPVAPRPHTPVGMTLSPHSSSESLDVGRWGLKPLSPCFTPPPPPRLFSLGFLPPLTTPTLSSLKFPEERLVRGTDGGRGIRTPWAGGSKRPRRELGLGLQVDTRRPERTAGHSRGLLPAARTRVLANGRQVR